MALIEWKENFSVGVQEIDTQHKSLINMINELNDAMKNRKGKEALEKIIQNLVSYVEKHFSTEERYFDKFGYPNTMEHKKEHSDFVQKVLEFNEGFEKGKLGLSIDVMRFLSDWLKNHILGSDQKYVRFFAEKGLK